MAASSLSGSLRRNWWPEVAIAIGLIIAPWILPYVGFNADIMSRILIWGLFGLGFDLLFGFTGLLSFGQAAFFGFGGFACAYLLTSGAIDSVLLALFLGTIAATIYGIVLGVLSLRRTGIYFAMITLAFGEMSFFLENSPLKAFTGGENGLPGVPTPTFNLGFFSYHVDTGWPLYGFIAVVFWLGFLIARRIVHSPFGAVMVSIRENTQRSVALGHQVQKYKLAVFAVAAAYGGLAGGLLGVLQAYMPPGAFALHTSGQLVMQTVIGGTGTLIGPLLGAAVWLWLRGVLQYIPDIGALWKLVLGVVFVILITVFRRGICGEILYFLKHRKALSEFAAESGRGSGTGDDERELAHEVTLGGGGLRPEPAAAGMQARVETEMTRPASEMAIARGRIRQLDARRDVPALESRGLTKHYGGVHAVTGVDISIADGELRALIGPNGAGKSTFFKMLAGEISPTAGDVYLHGERVTGRGATAVCQLGLSKSYQINQLFTSLTVRENMLIPVLARTRGPFRLDMLRGVHRVKGLEEQVEQTLSLVGLSDRADLPISVLAYGEKRRLEIGLALATSPTVLLLDEPLAGMSPAERVDTKKLLRRIRRGRTLVIVEHDMDAIFELAERITVLYEGELLADGTPEEIQKDQAVQDAYLGGMSEDESA